ncbi:hypothetical protein [Psychrobacillus sp.]|uniref:hypothetical protein n=1 Tax=Psychrobacillus sp. TaxID=1871623 RepID=UPI0028BEA268|nr:hypothetical protein [Psychrobacillus sp.]
MKKNLLKSTVAAAVLSSSIVAFSPIAYGKTTSVDLGAVKSELNKAAAQYVNPALTGQLAPSSSLYVTLNSAKQSYENTKKAINSSALSATEKAAKLSELDAAYNEKINKGLVSYIDAYNYATKYLAPIMKEMKEAEAKNDFAAVVKGYHQLSYQLKDRTSILYRFSGKAARDLLLENYKKPADAVLKELAVPVTIFMKMTELNTFQAAGKKEEALKAFAEIEALEKTLPATNKYKPTLSKEVAKLKAALTLITPTPAPVVTQEVLDTKVAALITGLNASYAKNIAVSSTVSNTLVVAIKEDTSVEAFSTGFYTTLVTGLGVTKVNGNAPTSVEALTALKMAFGEAKTLADLKGKTIVLPVTVGTELNVNFTIVFE